MLHSNHQCMRDTVSLFSYQHLMISLFKCFDRCIVISCYDFINISIMANNGDYFMSMSD